MKFSMLTNIHWWKRYERTHMHTHTNRIHNFALLFRFVVVCLCFFCGHNFLRFLWRTLQRLVNSSTGSFTTYFIVRKMFLRHLLFSMWGSFLQNKCAVWVNCRVFASDKWLYFCTLLVQLGVIGISFYFSSHTHTSKPTDRLTNFTWNI